MKYKVTLSALPPLLTPNKIENNSLYQTKIFMLISGDPLSPTPVDHSFFFERHENLLSR